MQVAKVLLQRAVGTVYIKPQGAAQRVVEVQVNCIVLKIQAGFCNGLGVFFFW